MGLDEMVTRIAGIIDPGAWKEYPASMVTPVPTGHGLPFQVRVGPPDMSARKCASIEKALRILRDIRTPDPVRMIRVAARLSGVESFGIGDIWTAVIDDFLGVR